MHTRVLGQPSSSTWGTSLRPFWPDLPSGLAEDEMIREIPNLFQTRLGEFSPSPSYHHHSVFLSLPCFFIILKNV